MRQWLTLSLLLVSIGFSTDLLFAQAHWELINYDSVRLRYVHIASVHGDTIIFSSGYFSSDGGRTLFRLPPKYHVDTSRFAYHDLQIHSESFWTDYNSFSTNQGEHWDTLKADIITDPDHGFSLDTYGADSANDRLWLNMLLHVTTDRGRTWRNIKLDSNFTTLSSFSATPRLFFADSLNGIYYCFQDPQRFNGGTNSLYHTTNGGSTWRRIIGGNSITWNAARVGDGRWLFDQLDGIAISNKSVDSVALVSTSSGIRETGDPGPYPIVVVDSLNYFVGTTFSVIHSSDGGNSWNSLGYYKNLYLDHNLTSIAFTDRTHGLATYAEGSLVRVTLTASAARSNPGTSPLAVYFLWDHSLKVNFPSNSSGLFSIVDVLGRTVLHREVRNESTFQLDVHGLPAGLYFCALNSGVPVRFVVPQ